MLQLLEMSIPARQDAIRPLRQVDVRRQFDAAASGFADSAFAHRHCFDGLLERLDPMQLDVRRALDLGSAVGAGSRRLAKRYRRARIVSVDLSAAMLREGRATRSRFARIADVQADATALPFATGAFDLAVANLLFPWITPLHFALSSVARVLREGGLFSFATLGPDSLGSLRDAWRDEDTFEHVNPFPDMHDIGDTLVRAGFSDPVLDVDRLEVTYRDSAALFADLTAAGARNLNRGRRPTLTGKHRMQRVRTALESNAADGRVTVELELVFGHAWGAGPPRTPGEYRVDPGSIGRIRRRR